MVAGIGIRQKSILSHTVVAYAMDIKESARSTVRLQRQSCFAKAPPMLSVLRREESDG